MDSQPTLLPVERIQRRTAGFLKYPLRCSCPLGLALVVVFMAGCSRSRPDPRVLTMIIESSPANLDPRVGTDSQSERIDELIFDSLVRKDERFNVQPWVAERWDIPDPLTYVFHLRSGIRFHDGRPLTARDVKWTIDSMMNGTVISPKAAAYQYVNSIDAPNDSTLVIHLKQPYAALLWNLSDGALGIVPYGSRKEFNQHPIGTGPFKFVKNEQDNEVVVVRNDDYWAARPNLAGVRFAVVPDATTRALELRNGSADVEINSLSADMLTSLRKDPGLAVEQGPGTAVQYVAFNLRDPVLRDVRVRQAIAFAIDVGPVIQYLWRNTARPADSVLPPEHWAHDHNLRPFRHDPEKARELLASAGYSTKSGSRLQLTMKISSSEESSRLLAVVLQQQLREIGIDLDIRIFEFATFYSDVQRGAFQMYTLRWVGGTNQDPDIFEYIFDSKSFPPRRANRSYYSNARVDQWIAQGLEQIDQSKRKESYANIQQQLQQDVPSINLWYLDNVIVHTRRVRNIHTDSAGNFDFLRTVELQ